MRHSTWKPESVSDILWMIVDSKFQVQQIILIFGTNFQKKGIRPLENTKKMIITIEFFIFELVKVPIFSLNWQLLFFGPNLPKRAAIFSLKQINRHHRWILHIRISLCIKFNFEQTILNFWTNFAQERYLWSKTEKLNIIIEFCSFKLVLAPNFSLNWKFWFSDWIYPKRVFLV